LGLFAQLAISVIAWPLKGTGFGETVTCTAPVPLPVGLGEGVGVGDGVGVRDGVGVGVSAGLLDRDGTPPVVTGVGEVGSVEPQLTATNAATNRTATRIQARMFLRNTPGVRVADGLYARRAPVFAVGARRRAFLPDVRDSVQWQPTHRAEMFARLTGRDVEERMLSTTGVRTAMAVLGLLAVQASSAEAQGTTSPNGGNIQLSAYFDVTNAYLFRGLRQDDTGWIMQPAADVGVRLFEAAGPVLHVGSWNSLHTGLAGLDGPTNRLWYESDFYTTLSFALNNDFAAGATYTAYTSPNGLFSTVKELSFKLGPTDSAALSNTFISPYALIAFELDTHPGLGQADGGQDGGTYLELGASPRWAGAPVDVFFPIRVGLSLSNYYELAGEDHTFGFLSLGAHAEVPFVRTSNYGAWNVHGGIDFYSLGDTPEAFNAGDQTKLVASVGIGFTY
jgi:hypothetical protein